MGPWCWKGPCVSWARQQKRKGQCTPGRGGDGHAPLGTRDDLAREGGSAAPGPPALPITDPCLRAVAVTVFRVLLSCFWEATECPQPQARVQPPQHARTQCLQQGLGQGEAGRGCLGWTRLLWPPGPAQVPAHTLWVFSTVRPQSECVQGSRWAKGLSSPPVGLWSSWAAGRVGWRVWVVANGTAPEDAAQLGHLGQQGPRVCSVCPAASLLWFRVSCQQRKNDDLPGRLTEPDITLLEQSVKRSLGKTAC